MKRIHKILLNYMVNGKHEMNSYSLIWARKSARIISKFTTTHVVRIYKTHLYNTTN